ncbi:MAG: hypothetical protein KAY32_18375 [Candidatus Eisenbacteria sp.]|nr:hypothetical protein [Candidatus Eisenbacteria bacterium]
MIGEQLVIISVLMVVSTLVLYLLYGVVKRKDGAGEGPLSRHLRVREKMPSHISMSVDSMIEKHGIRGGINKPVQTTKRGVGMRIIDGIESYSYRYLETEAAIQRKANELTQQEAWEGLRKSFWDTRRKALREVYPEIYRGMVYWEQHLDEYHTYMGIKFVFDLPYKEHDFWVRRVGK